jgi:hypothetical protein
MHVLGFGRPLVSLLLPAMTVKISHCCIYPIWLAEASCFGNAKKKITVLRQPDFPFFKS